MLCPHCSTETLGVGGQCSNCGKPLVQRGGQGADVLTELPPISASNARGAVEATIPPPTGPMGPGQAFGTRYHIIRTLGVGGMGAVYQAWDDELGVSVALKVIRPELQPDRTAAQDIERRFKREL